MAAVASMVGNMADGELVLHQEKAAGRSAIAAILEPEAPTTICHTAWAITEVFNVQVGAIRKAQGTSPCA